MDLDADRHRALSAVLTAIAAGRPPTEAVVAAQQLVAESLARDQAFRG